MAVQNTWLVEGRVMLTQLEGIITVDELIESSRYGTDTIDSLGVPPVFSIVDFTAVESYPSRIAELRRIADMGGTSQKLSWILLVGITNPILSFAATIFSQFAKTNYRTIGSIQEAYAFILERDPKLKKELLGSAD